MGREILDKYKKKSATKPKREEKKEYFDTEAFVKLRFDKNLTREAIANAIGYSVDQIYRIETQTSNPSWNFVCAVAEFFQVPLDTFLKK